MVYSSKENQKDLLEKEQIKVKKAEDSDSYVVIDYKKYLYCFDNLDIFVMKSLK